MLLGARHADLDREKKARQKRINAEGGKAPVTINCGVNVSVHFPPELSGERASGFDGWKF